MTQPVKLDDTHLRKYLWPEIVIKGLVIFLLTWIFGYIVSGEIAYLFFKRADLDWTKYDLLQDKILYSIAIMFLLFFRYRRKILHIIIKKFEYSSIYKLINYMNHIKYIIYLLFIFILCFTIVVPYSMYAFSHSIIVTLLWMSAFASCVMILFDNPLTKESIYLIQYAELYKNLDDFIDRQKWLRLICRNIEKVFKKGNIWINHDLLLYRINVGIKKDPKIFSFLKKTEKCFLSEATKDDLLIYVGEILPESDIILYDPLTTSEKVRRIPLENIKNAVGILLLIILLILKPTRFFEFLEKLAEKYTVP